MEFGMPTLIEEADLERCAALCSNLGLDFVELNMNMPQYQLDALDEKGVEIITKLILGHFKEGGTLININILDSDKLMAANKNPDLYPDLVVRVTGFTAYFASLSPEFRQLVVNRFLTNM